jgi:hypothetical protein
LPPLAGGHRRPSVPELLTSTSTSTSTVSQPEPPPAAAAAAAAEEQEERASGPEPSLAAGETPRRTAAAWAEDAAGPGEPPASVPPSRTPLAPPPLPEATAAEAAAARWAEPAPIASARGAGGARFLRRAPRPRSPPLGLGVSGVGGRGVKRLTAPSPAAPVHPAGWPRGRPPGVGHGPPAPPPWQPQPFAGRDPLSPRDQAGSAPLEVGATADEGL